MMERGEERRIGWTRGGETDTLIGDFEGDEESGINLLLGREVGTKEGDLVKN